MHQLARQILRPFLSGLLLLSLVACGNNDDENTSSLVYGSHSVVIVQSTTKSWGANGYGQLGNGTSTDSLSPVSVAVTVGVNFSQVSIGGAHSVALDTAAGGNVWDWGLNSSGQLGNGTQDSKNSPVQVLVSIGGPALTGVKAVAAGGSHTLAIASDDTVWAWGLNTSGQLGNNTLVASNIPVQVLTAVGVPLTDVTAIAAGGAFSLALKSDGTVWAWGSDKSGQLGNNTLIDSKTAVQVLGAGSVPLSGITAIAAGGSHALALDGSGTMYAWGYNVFGQLGDGTTTDSLFAVPVVRTGIIGSVTAISAGLDHSLAIIGGNVYAWGYNYYGQLGNGAALLNEAANPTLQIVLDQNSLALTNIETIVATGHHCIARDANSNVWTWGNDTYGQLGDGTTQSRSTAKVVISGV